MQDNQLIELEASDDEDNEINRQLLSSQEHDLEDENKRLYYSKIIKVQCPVSREIFPTAKRIGAKVIFTEIQ